jgi:hypothetical protein
MAIAIPLAFRIAVQLTLGSGAAYRIMKMEQASSGQPGPQDVIEYFWDRLRDPNDSDGDISAAASDYAGRVVEVATFSAPFELRKVQMIWSVSDAVVSSEDARVCTFHLMKVVSGTPSDAWDAGDFSDMDAAFTTWWTNIKDRFPSTTAWDRIKVYKDGPAITPPQVPVYDADKNVVGTGSLGAQPPQVAISVTEIAGSKRYWGRFFLPGCDAGGVAAYGRIDTTYLTDIADATDTLYTALQAAELRPVVYRPALPERSPTAPLPEHRTKGTFPARLATAWDVEKVQVDNVFDVIRRRRFKYPTLRVQRDI